jgi:hypothetical protein
MTPQEKAKELGSKFNFEHIGQNYILHQTVDESKRCALIAVEEILKRTRSVDTMPPNYQKIDENTKEYWEQVKIEIEKL